MGNRAEDRKTIAKKLKDLGYSTCYSIAYSTKNEPNKFEMFFTRRKETGDSLLDEL